MAAMNIEPFNATLTWRKDYNSELALFRVEHDAGKVPEFEAGQFATLGLPRADDDILKSALAKNPKLADNPEALKKIMEKSGRVRMVRRAYSIASSPLIRDYLEFFIVRVAEGKFTPLLWELPVGGRIWMEDVCKGEFTLDPVPPDRHVVLCSTGTGLAPYVSMVNTFRGKRRWRQCTIIHGVRHVPDFGYMDELKALAAEDRSFRYIPMCTRAKPEEWSGLHGRVPTILEPTRFAEVTGQPLDPATTNFFLCGNPDMINDVTKHLEDRGFKQHAKDAPGNIHTERYW